MKINFGAKSIVAGMTVASLAILLHFIVYIAVSMTSGQTFGTGFIAGIASAIGMMVVAIITTITYTFATKAREGMFSGGLYVLTILIIANLMRTWLMVLPLPFVVF